MAKKKTIDRDFIEEQYIDMVLQDKSPKTVYAFCKQLGIEEKQFYQFFPSLESIENAFLANMLRHSIDEVSKVPDVSKYTDHQVVSLVYFTFFEMCTANRSFVLYLLDTRSQGFSIPKKLKGIHADFCEFIDQTIQLNEVVPMEKVNKIQSKIVAESAWTQFLSILHFWKNDSSENFEKTDIYIEKSLRLGFDIIHHPIQQSVMDYSKFVWKEMISPVMQRYHEKN